MAEVQCKEMSLLEQCLTNTSYELEYKGNVHPRTGHEGPEGAHGAGIAQSV
jgi:hypothetical protein